MKIFRIYALVLKKTKKIHQKFPKENFQNSYTVIVDCIRLGGFEEVAWTPPTGIYPSVKIYFKKYTIKKMCKRTTKTNKNEQQKHK